MSIPKPVYGVIILVGIVGAIAFAPFTLYILGLLFPVLALLMLWDIMDGLNKIWAKLWEMDERLSTSIQEREAVTGLP